MMAIRAQSISPLTAAGAQRLFASRTFATQIIKVVNSATSAFLRSCKAETPQKPLFCGIWYGGRPLTSTALRPGEPARTYTHVPAECRNR